MKVMINGVERYFDGYLKTNLDALIKFVSLKWDGVVYVGGYEGDGKTTLALQGASYVDPSFCLDRVVFTPEQFMEAVDKAEVGQAIVYDEAQDAFDSSNRDTVSKLLKMKLTRIRKKRLFIFIVAADFWRINKYLFIHRSRAFIRIYSDGFSRGRFAFYNRERKHDLYVKGKKTESLAVVPPNFIGSFTNWIPVDEQAYERKKDLATESIGKLPGIDPKVLRKEIVKGQIGLLDWLRRNQWVKDGALTASLGFMKISTGTLHNYREELQNDSENSVLGGTSLVSDLQGQQENNIITQQEDAE